MRFRFLGTGTSVGVPQIGCDCPVCTSADPRDRRRRCGAHVSTGAGAFLVDTPPEMRLACLEYGIKKVDAVLLTHAHMDHVAAFDDVRRFNTINGTKVPCRPDEPGANGRTFRIVGKPLPCYAMPETIEQMHHIFPYIGRQGGSNGLFRPQIDFIDNSDPFTVAGVRVESLRVEHSFPCCGYLFEDLECRIENGKCGRLGYISDCHVIPDEVIERLKGVDVMVLNCLRVREHPTHLSLQRALAYLERIAPKRTYLVHMCHDYTHAQWLEMLPKGVEPAYDGLELEI